VLAAHPVAEYFLVKKTSVADDIGIVAKANARVESILMVKRLTKQVAMIAGRYYAKRYPQECGCHSRPA
jgi:hypothetical protein